MDEDLAALDEDAPQPPKWTPEQERRAREQKTALKELVKPLQADRLSAHRLRRRRRPTRSGPSASGSGRPGPIRERRS